MARIESIIERQLRRWEAEKAVRMELERELKELPPAQRVITISRAHGSDGGIIAARLAERFDCTALDHNVIDYICNSTGTRRRIVESLDEHIKPEITAWLDSVLGADYVDTSDYIRQLFEVISSVARLGGVVVVGRGASFIVGRDHGFHVRVVGPHDQRVQRVAERDHLSAKDAEHKVRTIDDDRRKFVRKIWKRDIDDPTAYDLMINREHLSMDATIRLIASAALEKFDQVSETTAP